MMKVLSIWLLLFLTAILLQEGECKKQGRNNNQHHCKALKLKCDRGKQKACRELRNSCPTPQNIRPGSRRACPRSCPRDNVQVCGSDGRTYANDCILRKVACKSRNNRLEAQYSGPCSPRRQVGISRDEMAGLYPGDQQTPPNRNYPTDGPNSGYFGQQGDNDREALDEWEPSEADEEISPGMGEFEGENEHENHRYRWLQYFGQQREQAGEQDMEESDVEEENRPFRRTQSGNNRPNRGNQQRQSISSDQDSELESSNDQDSELESSNNQDSELESGNSRQRPQPTPRNYNGRRQGYAQPNWRQQGQYRNRPMRQFERDDD